MRGYLTDWALEAYTVYQTLTLMGDQAHSC